jgi:hypothetical protein
MTLRNGSCSRVFSPYMYMYNYLQSLQSTYEYEPLYGHGDEP